jgi:hypothetical protein
LCAFLYNENHENEEDGKDENFNFEWLNGVKKTQFFSRRKP